MFNTINSQISFKACPSSLSGSPIERRSADQIYTIVKRACNEAGFTTPKVRAKDVFELNSKLFDRQKRVTKEGVRLLQAEFEKPIKSCKELYDELVHSYKKYRFTSDADPRIIA